MGERNKNQDSAGPAACATETSGLLIIAFALLVVTVIRYWHAIRWSLR